MRILLYLLTFTYICSRCQIGIICYSVYSHQKNGNFSSKRNRLDVYVYCSLQYACPFSIYIIALGLAVPSDPYIFIDSGTFLFLPAKTIHAMSYLPKIFIALCIVCVALLCVITALLHDVYNQNEEIFRLKKRLIDAECYQQADSLLQETRQHPLFEDSFGRENFTTE